MIGIEAETSRPVLVRKRITDEPRKGNGYKIQQVVYIRCFLYGFKGYLHLRSVKYTATFTQKLAVIMADENNNNGGRILISKPAGHHNQLYVLIFT